MAVILNSSERLQGTLVYLMLILAGDVELNPGPTLNDKPTTAQLKSLCKAGEAKPLRVKKEIAACKNYQDLADFLLGSDHAATIKTIKSTFPESSQFVDEMFEKWLELDDDDPNDSAAPRTWRSLAESIKQADLPGTLAKSIRDVCSTYESASAAAPPITTTSQPLGGSAAEIPLFELTAKFKRENKPLTPPNEESERQAVKEFATNVKVVIQTCNPPEYFAALEKLEPPNQEFTKPVEYFHTDLTIVVGTFAGVDAAVIKTEQGAKCITELKVVFDNVCTNATMLLGLGVCYGLKKKHNLKFADVLVGKKINIIEAPKFKADGTMDLRGEIKTTHRLVQKMFCEDADMWDDFVCEKASKRIARAFVGLLASASFLIDNPQLIQGLENSPDPYLGGEMEGWAQIKHTPERVKCIIIKGIADFGDGTKDKVWQLTAAKAAVDYAHYKLKENIGHLEL